MARGTNPALIPMYKELALKELEEFGGDEAQMFRRRKRRFDEATVTRYRKSDPEFDKKWQDTAVKFPHWRGGGRFKDSPQVREKFLELLRQGHSPTRAARDIGVTYQGVKSWKLKDKDFSTAWDEALEEGTDTLEDAARLRAVDGVERPVYQGGKLVGAVTEYSDGLLTTLLQARRPWKFKRYSDNPLTPPPNFTVQADLSRMTPEELARLYRETIGALNGDKPGQ